MKNKINHKKNNINKINLQIELKYINEKNENKIKKRIIKNKSKSNNNKKNEKYKEKNKKLKIIMSDIWGN